MQSMQQTPQVMIMTAGREGDEKIAKQAASSKIDKSGIRTDADSKGVKSKKEENKMLDPMTKIKTAQHVPKMHSQMYRHLYQDYSNVSLVPAFVTAGDND